MASDKRTEFVELWVCPRGDAAYAIQRGALAEFNVFAQRKAQEAERKHREKHPEHFDPEPS